MSFPPDGGRDLDERGALSDERAHFVREDRDEGLRRSDAVRVDTAADQPPGERERPGDSDLERPAGPSPRIAELLDHAKPFGSGDRLDDLEAVLLVVAGRADPPLGLERPQAREVSVELGGEEARAAHLAVRDDVDAGVLLVAERGIDRIVLELGDVDGAKLTASGSGHADDQPRRMGVRAHDARCQIAAEPRRRLRHETPAKTNARPGLPTKIASCASEPMPRSRICSANGPSRNVQPGEPP